MVLNQSGGGFQEGGPTSYRRGFLKRRLPSLRVAQFLNSGEGSDAFDARVEIKGLSGNLFYLIGVCAIPEDAAQEILPLIDSDNAALTSGYPVDPGQFQITPFTDPPNSPRQIWRPVFQDPTFTDNKNHPLAQQIPFAWSVDGDEADGAYVDIHVPTDAWVPEAFRGALVVTLVIEYNGAWWSTEALEKAISMVVMNTSTAQPPTISTGGG